jgi:uncharacterized protein (TIGR00251 family)
MACFSAKGDRVIVRAKISTGARGNRICGIKNDELLIQIKAQPEKDKANRELVIFLSKFFGISRSEVDIRSGSHSHHKLINLPRSIEFRLHAIQVVQ